MNLNKDLIRSISFLIPIHDILDFRLICRKFNEALSLDYYWLKRIKMDFPKYTLEPKHLFALQLYQCLHRFKQFELPLCQVDVGQVEEYLKERYELSCKFRGTIVEDFDLSRYKVFTRCIDLSKQAMVARIITWSRCKSLDQEGCFHLDIVCKEKDVKFRLVINCIFDDIDIYVPSCLSDTFWPMFYQFERLIYLTEPTFYIWNKYVSWSKFEEYFKFGPLSLDIDRLAINPALNLSITLDQAQLIKTLSIPATHKVVLEFDEPGDILFELDQIGLYRGVPTRLKKDYTDLEITMTCLCHIDARFITEISKMFLEDYDLIMMKTT